MAKGKKKGGLTGISAFAMKEFLSSESSPATSREDVPREDFDEGSADIHASKKRRLNEAVGAPGKLPGGVTSGVSGTWTTTEREREREQRPVGWVQKYDARGLASHYTTADQVPEHLQKYFSQRHRFFSLYSSPPGCLLDEEGWYSVTPELIADRIAERCRCDTILDAFCGVGGNAIAFAKTCQRVIALDTSITRLALARHNAQIYGVADRIEFILTDYVAFAKTYAARRSASSNASSASSSSQNRIIDAVFLSPPWGGPAYLSGSAEDSASDPSAPLPSNDIVSESEHPSYSLASIQPLPGQDLFQLTQGITQNIAFYLPRNTRLEEISALVKTPGDLVEVEEEWMGNKLKALTCYFGGLVEGQEHMFDAISSEA